MGNMETRFKEVSQQHMAVVKAIHKIERIIEALHDEMDNLSRPEDYGQELHQRHGDEVL